jgi:hypothetical protein
MKHTTMDKVLKKQLKLPVHNLAGELIGGYLFVHELFCQAPWDRSWLYLVENLKTGEAELWRFTDLRRIARTGRRQQRCKGDGYRAGTGPERNDLRACYEEDLARAKQRLNEIRAAEPNHHCVVVTDTDEEGTVTERCGGTAPHRFFGRDEMWLCATHLPFMAKVDWNERNYY